MSIADAELIFKKYWKPHQQSMAKYVQLVGAIQSAITGNYLSPGSKLPTEMDFVKGTPFSLGTVQRAMRILVDRGVIERHQGVGSFVAKTSSRLDYPQQCRIFNDEWDGFLEIFTQIVGRVKITKKGPWTRHLGEHLDSVMRIERVLLIAQEFKVLTRFYFDSNRIEALRYIPVAKLDGANFRELLDREFGLAVWDYDHALRVEAFDDKISDLTDCKVKTTGAVLEAIAYSDTRIPLYFQEFYIPPNARTLLVSGVRQNRS